MLIDKRDYARDGYSLNVWQAIALARDSILDANQFDKALDALEAILLPSMTEKEQKELEQIKMKKDAVINKVNQKIHKILQDETQSQLTLASSTNKLNYIKKSAEYEFNILRYKLFCKIAHRVFVAKQNYPTKEIDLEKEVNTVFNKYELVLEG